MPRPVTTPVLREIIPKLRAAVTGWQTPLVDAMSAAEDTPFKILVATLISLRTRDTVTAVVAPRLFALADTPARMLTLTEEQIAQAIYPAGFYKTKAVTLRKVSKLLIDKHKGQVPDTIEGLVALPGVGLKTANLVLTAGFGKPGICVDTHVHRITNRWGYVHTKTPEDTEFALRKKLPSEYWIELNGLLVALGQNVCHPTSPRCTAAHCPRKGVTRSR